MEYDEEFGRKGIPGSLLEGVSEPVGNQPVRCIVGRDAHLDPVSCHYLDPEFFHSAGEYAPYSDVVITFDLHCAAAQNLGDHAFQLD